MWIAWVSNSQIIFCVLFSSIVSFFDPYFRLCVTSEMRLENQYSLFFVLISWGLHGWTQVGWIMPSVLLVPPYHVVFNLLCGLLCHLFLIIIIIEICLNSNDADEDLFTKSSLREVWSKLRLNELKGEILIESGDVWDRNSKQNNPSIKYLVD